MDADHIFNLFSTTIIVICFLAFIRRRKRRKEQNILAIKSLASTNSCDDLLPDIGELLCLGQPGDSLDLSIRTQATTLLYY